MSFWAKHQTNHKTYMPREEPWGTILRECGPFTIVTLWIWGIKFCRRFGPARTLNRLVNLSLRVPAQMGWCKMEHKREDDAYIILHQGARSRGYKRRRERERERAGLALRWAIWVTLVEKSSKPAAPIYFYRRIRLSTDCAISSGGSLRKPPLEIVFLVAVP
jgi:hypothetical protein